MTTKEQQQFDQLFQKLGIGKKQPTKEELEKKKEDEKWKAFERVKKL